MNASSEVILSPGDCFREISPGDSFRESTRGDLALIALFFIALLALSQLSFAASATRTPLSTPIEDIDFKREMLAGSDALLERMVIPPDRPDWVVMDCAGHSDVITSFDRVRESLCDLKRKN